MSCSIKYPTVFKALQKMLGEKNTIIGSIIAVSTTKIDGNNYEFSDGFINYYKLYHDGKEPECIVRSNAKGAADLIKSMRDYFNYLEPDINYTSGNAHAYPAQEIHGYDSEATAIKARNFVVGYISTIYNEYLTNPFNITNVNRVYKNKVSGKIRRELLERLARQTARTYDDVREESLQYKDPVDVINYFKQAFGEDIDAQTKNLLAMYSDVTTGDIFKIAMQDRRVVNIFSKDNTENKDIVLSQEEQEFIDDLSPELEGESDRDMYIASLDNKMGVYSDFIKHFDKRVVAFLNSLTKTRSIAESGESIEDNNNEFGLPETLDARTVLTVLMNGTIDCSNVENMVDGIEKLSISLPGYSALKKLADKCRKDTDFACVLFRNIGKTVISKYRTQINANESSIVQSNTRSNKKDSLAFQLINNFKQSALANGGKNTNVADDLKKSVSTLRTINNNEIRDKVVTTIVKALQSYFPSISERSIRNYIFNHIGKEKSPNMFDNMNNIIDIIKKLEQKSKIVYNQYEERELAINKVREANKALLRQQIENEIAIDPSALQSYDEAYAKEFITSEDTAPINDLVNEIVDYVDVTIDLNSTNVHGNNNSDIINNSWLTYWSKILNSDEGLKMLSEDKFQSSEYEFSNILIERKERGKVINYGLFTKENGKYVPTSYAKQLLEISLYDGAKNTDNNDAVTYAQMSKGDYTCAAFINYFNDVYKRNQGKSSQITFGTYFLRIMSDAPKTFTIRAPRYSVKGLWQESVENAEEVNGIINNLPMLDADTGLSYQSLENSNNSVASVVSATTMAKLALGKQKTFTLEKNARFVETKVKDGDEAQVLLYLPDEVYRDNPQKGEFNGNYAIIKGKASINKNKRILEDVEFVGFANLDDRNFEPKDISANLRIALKNTVNADRKKSGSYKANLITDHPVFLQFRNAFMQELTDMATAIDVMFETTYEVDETTGKRYKVVKFENNKPILKAGITLNKLYDNYHKKKGKILEEDGLLKYKLVGNVFNSSKFTLFDDDKNEVRNYGQEILKEAFNILYGGAQDALHFDVDDKGHVSIQLTDNQEQIIVSKLTEFINDYTIQSIARCGQFRDIIENSNSLHVVDSEDTIFEDNVEDFALNHYIMYMSFDEMFEGNNKYYKDSQTALKRAKEIQASGVPYAATDVYGNQNTPNDDTNLFDYPELLAIQTPSSPSGIKVHKQFTGVTIENTVLDRDEIKALANDKYIRLREEEHLSEKDLSKEIQKERKALINKAKETNSEYDEDRINTIAKRNVESRYSEKLQKLEKDAINFAEKAKITERYKDVIDKLVSNTSMTYDDAVEYMLGFLGTTVNDAQSYITFDEFIRRIALRGQLHRYLPLINKILDESVPLDAETLSEFVQVQKNFYYDIRYDAVTKSHVPRQIKNAEFVLIPRFIKGTQLEKVAELMAKYGIDQLNTAETSKAGKKYVLTLWNNKREFDSTNFENNVNAAKEYYSYTHLYTQQETPQHMATENKAGIQIMKKILDNIPFGHPLYYKKEEFFALYSQNIISSFNKFCKENGIELDENGNLQLDYDGNITNIDFNKLFKRFKEEAQRTTLTINSDDYFALQSLNTLFPDTIMPLEMSIFSRKAENIAQSAVNSDITRQKLPGFHAAQITNVGWSSMSTTLVNKSKDKLIKDNQFKSFMKEKHPDVDIKKVVLTDDLRNEFKSYLEDIESKIRTYSRELRYHPNGENYVEVLVPRSIYNFDYNIYVKDENGNYIYDTITDDKGNKKRVKRVIGRKTDAMLLEEINDNEELSKFIGYRIPTEGKQSICVMKVVGFIDDALGSTIVVPDDWVAQTGSDFDIDSVYAINYVTYIDKNGKIRKQTYKDELDQYDWFNYINKTLAKNNEDKLDKKLDTNVFNQINAEYQEEFEELINSIGSLFTDIPKSIQVALVELNKDLDNEFKGTDLSTKNARNRIYVTRLQRQNAIIKEKLDIYKSKNNPNQDKIAATEELLRLNEEMIEFLDSQIYEAPEEMSEAKKEQLDARIDRFTDTAERLGLMSLDEYINQSPAKVNSRSRRNNRILDLMIEILQHDSSLEENIARSNFEDIITTRNAIYKKTKGIAEKRAARSPYNFFDQAEYQEDVMSGAKLKAFSVTRDTFNSICNTVRPKLNEANKIGVIYRPKANESVKELATRLSKSFDDIAIKGNEVIVYHNTIGWSHNNKNVAGKILTCYSSQTTAHILDAVKEGAIPNVNDLTFGTYKLIVDVGSDYRTAISFIMQPGVARIVAAYNRNKSIFSSENNNPVHTAIKEIAIELGVKVLNSNGKQEAITKYTPINKVITALQLAYNDRACELFGKTGAVISLDWSNNSVMALDADRYETRIATEGLYEVGTQERTDQLIEDLITILQYNNLSSTSEQITNVARVCNPDKFGAKQSIFATSKVFDDINTLIKRGTPLEVEGYNSFLEAIYPGVTSGIDGILSSEYDVMSSKYPPLYSFLKYATALSVKVNKQLFKTQSDAFRFLSSQLKDYLTQTPDRSNRMTEELDYDFKSYCINILFKNTPFMLATPTVTDGVYSMISDVNPLEEIRRIHGFGYSPLIQLEKNGEKVPFEVKDINHVTKDEIADFAKLSPAQKVAWIQNTFKNKGIFGQLEVNLYNDYEIKTKGISSQTITFNSSNFDTNLTILEHYAAYNNTNPLIKLAAIDLIKYAVEVEGFKMKKNGISNIISNKVMLDDEINDFFIEDFKSQLNNTFAIDITDPSYMTPLLDRFIRSHSDINQIAQVTLKTTKRVGDAYLYDVPTPVREMFIFDITNENHLEALERYKIGIRDTKDKEEAFIPNKYIKLVTSKHQNNKKVKEVKLYKIQRSDNIIYVYPISRLEESEFSDISSNRSNNVTYTEDFYQKLISVCNRKIQETSTDTRTYSLNDIAMELRTESNDYQSDYRIRYTYKQEKAGNRINLRSEKLKNSVAMNDLADIIKEFFNDPIAPKRMYFSSIPTFFNFGTNTSTQIVIDGENYTITREYSLEGRLKTKYYVNKQENKELDPQIREIVDRAISGNYPVNSLYSVKKEPKVEVKKDDVNPSVQESAFLENPVNMLASSSIQTISNEARITGDRNALNIYQIFKEKNINTNNQTIEDNLPIILENSAIFVQNNTARIIDSLTNFVQDELGNYVPINSDYAIEQIQRNPELRNKFLKTILDANKFVRKYGAISNVDIQSQPEEIRPYLRRIKESIDSIKDAAIINNANIRYVNEFLGKLSDNPLVQQDIISLMSGYHSTSFLASWIADTQENGNPLIQIVTKDVMANIRAADSIGKDSARKFRKDIETIISKAGSKFNWSHIIKNGRFIKPYNEEFENTIRKFVSDLTDIAIDKSRLSEEYIAKKLEFDEFKLKYINQELDDNYYASHLKNDLSMFYGTDEDGNIDKSKRGFRDIYIRYLTIKNEQYRLRRRATNGVLSLEDQAKYDAYDEEIKNLTSTGIYDPSSGEFVEKPEFLPVGGTVEQRINNQVAAKKLYDYIQKRRDIDKGYFTYVPKPTFEEDLKKNLQIVETKERRNPFTNEPSVDMSILASDEEYMKAKQWLRDNARFIPDAETSVLVYKAFKTLKGDRKYNRGRLNLLAKKYKAYDELGFIIPDDFTDDDLKNLKDDLERYYRDQIGLSEQHLIKFGEPFDEVYKDSFYKGMNKSGISNAEYVKYVKIINDILVKHLVGNGRIIRFEEMSAEEISILTQAYNAMSELKSMIDVPKEDATRVAKFIHNNVDMSLDQESCDQVLAKGNPSVTKSQLLQLLTEPATKYVVDPATGEGHYEYDIDPDTHLPKRIPRRAIFGRAVPNNDKWIDFEKTEAKKAIKNKVRYITSKYYYAAKEKARALGEDAYKDWFEKNHVYNPNTKRMEPLPIWTKIELGDRNDPSHWQPADSQTIREIASPTMEDEEGNLVINPFFVGGKNDSYKENVTLADNYKENVLDRYGNPDRTYANPKYIRQTDEEKEVIKLIKDTLNGYALVPSAQRYINSGNLPSLSKDKEHDKKWWATEILKTFGFIDESNTGKGKWHDLGMISYANDLPIDMPMLHKLADKTVGEKPQFEPRRVDETDESYYTRLKAYHEAMDVYNAKVNEVHSKMLNEDYISAVESFIQQAAHYNAIQENKYALYHCQEMLDKIGTYVTRFGRSDLIKDYNASRDGNTVYLKQTDKKGQEQLANFIRRLVFDEWKTPHGTMTKIMNCMQQFTSAKYMMLNVTGGIANVTVGYANILGEAAGSEYFNRQQLSDAWVDYHKSIGDYLAHLYDEESSTLVGALIKFMNIVDFTEITGQVHTDATLKWLNRVRNAAYSTQTSGEHNMQNVAMIAMAKSHKVFEDPRYKISGRSKYRIMNEAEYVREYILDKFEDILTGDQLEQFRELRRKYANDPNQTKELVWNRENLITVFGRKLDRNTRKEFSKKYKDLQEQARKEFNKPEHKALIEHLALTSEGYLGFKDDSEIKPVDTPESDWNLKDAYKLLATFQGRCISVNKKIHGVYDRLGAARLESQLFGSIVMQYHKHIYPGMMKRWRTKGYFNEERGTQEKGSYIALYDFLKMPFKEWLDANKQSADSEDPELQSLLGIQNLFKNYIEFFSDISTNWNLLDDNEKANIKRAFNDGMCIAAGIMTSIALQLAFRDKDKEGALFNLALYEADRFVSETGMYTPIGLPAEYKTLWSSPIAAQTGLSEMTTAFNECVKMLVQGSDYDPTYQTGLYAGQNKFEVYAIRQIPIVRSYNRLQNLNRNNRYFKLGTTTFGFLNTSAAADAIRNTFK